MKRLFCVIPLVCLLCFVVGCQDKAAMAELEAIKAQAAVEEQNKETVRHFYEEIDRQNFEAAIAMLSPDAKLYASGGFEPAGRDDLRPIFPVWFTAFPDYVHDIQEVIAEGNKVVVRTIYTGTHKGDFFGAPPTGNTFKYLGIHELTLKDNMIVEAWVLEDMLYLWQQLGWELKPKEAEK